MLIYFEVYLKVLIIESFEKCAELGSPTRGTFFTNAVSPALRKTLIVVIELKSDAQELDWED